MLPIRREIYFSFLWEIEKRGGKVKPSEKHNGKNVYESLAEEFHLSQQDLDEEVSNNENKWENIVRWSRDDLVKMGFIGNAVHGVWELTDRGREALELIKECCSQNSNEIKMEKSSSPLVADRKKMYENAVSILKDKKKALCIVCGNDKNLMLQVLGK